MKEPPPVPPGGGRELGAKPLPSSLPSRPRPVHPLDQPNRSTSAEPDLDPDLDPDRPAPTESGLADPDSDPGWGDPDLDFNLRDDAERRALLAGRAERPGAQTYLTGPTSTFEDGQYEDAIVALTTLIPSAKIIDSRSLFRDLSENPERWSPFPYGIDRLVFITADDGTIGWGVYGEIYDAQEQSLPVHLLDLDSTELVPARELHLVSTVLVGRGGASSTRSYYVFRRWPFELFVVLARFLKHFWKAA